MSEFLNIAFSLPTIVFTVGFVVSLGYWLFVVLGLLDIDLFDVDVEVDLDGALDGALEGAADSALEASIGAAEVFGDGVDGLEGAADAKAGALMKMLSLFSVGRVPVTILASFFVFYGWVLTFVGSHVVKNVVGMPMNAVMAVGLLVGASVLSTMLMGASARPLRGAFDIVTQYGDAALIGQVCIVSTGRVTTRFGQATLSDGGGGLNLTIRADTDENNIKRGDQVLIVGFDRETSTFLVESYQTVLGFDEIEDAMSLGAEMAADTGEEDASGERV